MRKAGVSDIAIYVPQYYLPHEMLAEARGIPKEKYTIGLGNRNMSILPNYEDTVTMASNATVQLLEKTGTHPSDIRQFVVSTESGVDHSKPVASFVQGLLDVGPRCRVYEIKHACYGGTAGLVNSIDKISLTDSDNDKAVVIMTDIAKYGFGTLGEPTQGAGAIAILIEKDPKLFTIDTNKNGVFSKNVFDFWRPTGHRVPVVDGRYSIECYLRALRECTIHLRSNLGFKPGELFENLDYIVYHLPYCKMAKKAHQCLIDTELSDLSEKRREQIFQETYPLKVEPGLVGAREVGNIYTGSVYMSLVSLLESEKTKVEGKNIGLFSYGSGSGAEFMVCNVNPEIGPIIDKLNFLDQINRRKKVTFEQYTQMYSKNGEEVYYPPEEVIGYKDDFTKFVFTGFKEHKRIYV